MQTFNDSLGNEWSIDLNPETVARVKERSDGQFYLLDPNALRNGKPFWRFLDNSQDMVVFWEVLFYIVEPQAMERDVTACDFGRVMAADILFDAQAAFFREWESMFLAFGKPSFANSVRQIADARAKALTKARTKLERARKLNILKG